MDEKWLLAILGPSVAWQIIDYFRSKSKDRSFQEAQGFINRSHDEKILEIKNDLKEFKDMHSKDIQERVLFRQTIVDGIKDIKTEIALLKDYLQRDIADHEKRLEVLEKKVLK